MANWQKWQIGNNGKLAKKKRKNGKIWATKMANWRNGKFSLCPVGNGIKI